jgi:four helix bundle protein
MRQHSQIQNLTFDFSVEIIELHRKLIESKEFVLSKQLLKSATSIGANVEEASAAQSKKDFIAKICIASKEARETKYWLRLLEKSDVSKIDYTPHLLKIDHIVNMVTKIIKTAQNNT